MTQWAAMVMRRIQVNARRPQSKRKPTDLHQLLGIVLRECSRAWPASRPPARTGVGERSSSERLRAAITPPSGQWNAEPVWHERDNAQRARPNVPLLVPFRPTRSAECTSSNAPEYYLTEV